VRAFGTILAPDAVLTANDLPTIRTERRVDGSLAPLASKASEVAGLALRFALELA